MAGLGAAACDSRSIRAGAPQPLNAVYSHDDGRLEQLRYDADGDGRIDTWAYFSGIRIARIEVDSDGNGTIDRWEYYGVDQRLQRIAISTSGRGVPDQSRPVGPAECGAAGRLVDAAEAAGITAAIIPTRPAAGADR